MSVYIWLAFARFTFSWLRLYVGLAAANVAPARAEERKALQPDPAGWNQEVRG